MKRTFVSLFVFGILVSFEAQSPAFAGGACCAVKGNATPAATGQVENVDVTENPAHVEHFADSDI